MFNLGNLATYPNGTGYLFVTGKDSGSFYRGTMASGGFATEQSASRAGGLSTGVWKHVTLTVDGGTPAAPGTASCTRTACWSRPTPTSRPSRRRSASRTARRRATSSAGRRTRATAPSRARIRDFRIYNRALDAGEAATLSAETSTAATDADKAALTLGDTSAVTANLTLPATGPAGVHDRLGFSATPPPSAAPAPSPGPRTVAGTAPSPSRRP